MFLSPEYLAGFFDGEGNVGIYKGGGTGRTLRVQITQAQSPEAFAILKFVQGNYGGSICEFNKTLRRPAWNYQVGGDGAWQVLRYIEPYLVLKKAQVELALLWYESRPERQRDPLTGRHVARSEEDRVLSDRVADLLKRMKRDVVMNDAADLVEVQHTLRQIVNIKGD